MGLDVVEMVMNVEEAFGVRIDDEEAATVRTVGDLHRVVMSKVWPEPPSVVDCDDEVLLLRRIIAKYTSVPIEGITRDSRLIDDLGLG